MSGVSIRSCLERIVPSGVASRHELEALRQRAFVEKGVVVLHLDEIADDWVKQAIVNIATKRWGRRMKR